jgi:hypothetical protein
MPDVRQVSFRRVGRPGNGGAGGEQISPLCFAACRARCNRRRFGGGTEPPAPPIAQQPIPGQRPGMSAKVARRACRGSAQQAGDGLRERPDA